ncbi:MAG: hypothetical protein Q8880_12165 [Bacteroidota bacterium]|nr:hypothetical protein [Bacteroidota bacterium]
MLLYKKIKPQCFSEEELRKIWKEEYCEKDIYTFDNVIVEFHENQFDHLFYESYSRIKKDKSILSLNRLEKILWIKDVLQDNTAILKKGWDNIKKVYYEDRRVAIVKNNYIVIICFTGLLKATIVSAYEKNDITKIINSPDFEKTEKYFGKL